MPLVTAFNLRREDPLSEIEEAVRHAMISIPALEINDYEVDLVPICEPDGFRAIVTRIMLIFGNDARVPKMLCKIWPQEWPGLSNLLLDRKGR